MEQSVASARATVLVYDDHNKRWVPAGPSQTQGVSKVHIYQNTSTNAYRVVGRKLQDHEVVLNCPVLKNLRYNQATATFHQWRDQKLVYGLNFISKEDADAFAAAMQRAVEQLIAAHKAKQAQAAQQADQKSAAPQSADSQANNNVNSHTNATTNAALSEASYSPQTTLSQRSQVSSSDQNTSSTCYVDGIQALSSDADPVGPTVTPPESVSNPQPSRNVPPSQPPAPPPPPVAVKPSPAVTLAAQISTQTSASDKESSPEQADPLAVALRSVKLKRAPETARQNSSGAPSEDRSQDSGRNSVPRSSLPAAASSEVFNEMQRVFAARKARVDAGCSEATNGTAECTPTGSASPKLASRNPQTALDAPVTVRELQELKAELISEIRREIGALKSELVDTLRQQVFANHN